MRGGGGGEEGGGVGRAHISTSHVPAATHPCSSLGLPAYNVLQAWWAERLDTALLSSRLRHTSSHAVSGPSAKVAGGAALLSLEEDGGREVSTDDSVLLPVDRLLLEVWTTNAMCVVCCVLCVVRNVCCVFCVVCNVCSVLYALRAVHSIADHHSSHAQYTRDHVSVGRCCMLCRCLYGVVALCACLCACACAPCPSPLPPCNTRARPPSPCICWRGSVFFCWSSTCSSSHGSTSSRGLGRRTRCTSSVHGLVRLAPPPLSSHTDACSARPRLVPDSLWELPPPSPLLPRPPAFAPRCRAHPWLLFLLEEGL